MEKGERNTAQRKAVENDGVTFESEDADDALPAALNTVGVAHGREPFEEDFPPDSSTLQGHEQFGS